MRKKKKKKAVVDPDRMVFETTVVVWTICLVLDKQIHKLSLKCHIMCEVLLLAPVI